MINLDTGEVVASKMTLARRYNISSDRINYSAINHKLLLGQYAWQYIDQLETCDKGSLAALRQLYGK